MRNFLRLISVARVKGVIGVQSGKPVRFNKVPQFWDAVEKCEPFVFTPSGEPAQDLGDDSALVMGIDSNEKIDAPFPVFSIEMTKGFITKPRETDEQKWWISCIIVQELRPKQFCYYAFMQNHPDYPTKEEVFASNAEGKIVEEFIARLEKEEIGVAVARASVKIGTGNEKRHIRVKRVTYVTQKRSLQNPFVVVGQTIDWSHRWTCRGHWRSLPDGLGKDREGMYCVQGWTWVIDHEKGNPNAPLINKVRVVR